eukprot:Gregarina_sp_Poly_1__5411@NODE_285_length_10045_cov_61_806174_g246_i0_p3_GENE_NODE_285_length_10045_cov_61_806174_g246_i0NODE_285_length_10045_cov_61_806174_g246_i0_p3_ORF_typecomplete_len275_score25_82DUF4579/PF15158_6/11DUF4579/PF15158_6/7_3e03DUF4579/PF15158_6/0_57DUF2104/PF09877_9/1_6DUF2104/PF09877_9/96_NODE_285_length_10045_cov_61_806174_g246_i063167140
MNDQELGYVPVAQSFAVGHVSTGWQAATHSFVAPESNPIVPVKEVPGDYVSPSVPSMDTPNLKSLSGIIICCLMTAIVLSMFACVGRSDFTFPFLLFAYLIWCWESSWSSAKITQIAQPAPPGVAADLEMKDVAEVYERTSALVPASARTVRNVQGVTLLLLLVTCIDAVWIFAAYNAWTCDFEDDPVLAGGIDLDAQQPITIDPLYCFNQDTQKPLIITYRLHRFILWISNINFVLKIIIIVLSTLWANQQRRNKVAQNSLPGLTSEHPTTTT